MTTEALAKTGDPTPETKAEGQGEDPVWLGWTDTAGVLLDK